MDEETLEVIGTSLNHKNICSKAAWNPYFPGEFASVGFDFNFIVGQANFENTF